MQSKIILFCLIILLNGCVLGGKPKVPSVIYIEYSKPLNPINDFHQCATGKYMNQTFGWSLNISATVRPVDTIVAQSVENSTFKITAYTDFSGEPLKYQQLEYQLQGEVKGVKLNQPFQFTLSSETVPRGIKRKLLIDVYDESNNSKHIHSECITLVY